MELLRALGLDWKIFLTQLLNFALLYFVLAKAALPKIRAMMIKREQEIDDGLKNAEAAKLVLAQAKTNEEEILVQARTAAVKIIEESRIKAKLVEDKIVAQAKETAQKIVATGEEQVIVAKEKMLQDVKEELAEVIAIGVKNLTGEEVSAKKVTTSYLKQGLIG